MKKFLNSTLRIVTLAAALAAGPTVTAAGPETDSREEVIKAAFILNFIRFTEWPENTATIEICHVTLPDFGMALGTLDGRSANGRTIAVRAVETEDKDMSSCQVLVVDDRVRAKAMSLSPEQRTLVISDGDPPDGIEPAITLKRFGPRIRFEVDLDNARTADMKLSSKLLRLALTVKE